MLESETSQAQFQAVDKDAQTIAKKIEELRDRASVRMPVVHRLCMHLWLLCAVLCRDRCVQELDLRHEALLERFEEQKTRKGAHAASKENAIVRDVAYLR